jgi:hypothetical protein
MYTARATHFASHVQTLTLDHSPFLVNLFGLRLCWTEQFLIGYNSIGIEEYFRFQGLPPASAGCHLFLRGCVPLDQLLDLPV